MCEKKIKTISRTKSDNTQTTTRRSALLQGNGLGLRPKNQVKFNSMVDVHEKTDILQPGCSTNSLALETMTDDGLKVEKSHSLENIVTSDCVGAEKLEEPVSAKKKNNGKLFGKVRKILPKFKREIKLKDGGAGVAQKTSKKMNTNRKTAVAN